MMHDRDLIINATAFKAQCLDILSRIGAHQLSRVTVTKRGKPVAVIEAPKARDFAIDEVEDHTSPIGWGSMRGTITLPDGVALGDLNDIEMLAPNLRKFDRLFDRKS